MTGRFVIGVDVGGTFTDIFVWDEAAGKVRTGKVPSTKEDQSQGFIQGIAAQIDEMADIATVIHGTTVGTNALLERKGAKTGLITSAGFGDVLEMRRRDRPRTWGLWGQFEPVISRDLRREIPERTHADGAVHTAVDPEAAKHAAGILRDAGCQSVCVFFINSYASAANEAVAAEAVRAVWPNAYVTVSTEIIPEIREFERASTAALNAYLQPVVSSYLDRLQGALAGRGAEGDVLIVQSNGGVMAVETAKRFPVRTALSGPAAGVIAARAIAKAAGFENVITCDMGGTSFDVSLIADGEAALAAQTAIDFGMVVRTPMVEITTIGAGGGSIAWVDAGGILQVGPESAGSDPGPACYGLGSERPTVTDANLVLGRINADRPIGGKLDRLDVTAAEAAIRIHVAEPLGLDPLDAAEAVLRVANAKMAGAIRLVSIERGHDPAKFAAMPFGGGGALHAGALMHDVGLGAAVVPRFPGVTSALGCVVADMRHDRVQTVNRLLGDLDCPALEVEMRAVAEETQALLDRAGVAFERIDEQFELDMLYLGQTHTVAVPLKLDRPLTPDVVQEAFDAAYLRAYGRLLEAIPVRVLNYRVAVTGRRPSFDMSVFAPPQNRVEDCQRGARQIRFDGADLTAPVYERLDLSEGATIPGPALLEQPDTTIFIDPGLEGTVDRFGNITITRGDADAAD